MKKDSITLTSVDLGDINSFRQNLIEQNTLIEKKRSIYKNYYKSKWSNLKFFIQDKISLQSSIRLLKTKTIEQFSPKCIEIYRKKLEIQLISKKNKEMFTSIQFDYHNTNKKSNTQDNNSDLCEEKDLSLDEIISLLKIQEGIKGLPTMAISDFLFKFREDNNLMMRLIECLNVDQFEIIVPFLCHFFYENFYIENNEQEEILYIIYLLLEREIDSLFTPSVTTFLDKSFISMFLSQMSNRYEIKHYIDIVLNYLIRKVEEINISFYSLYIEDKNKDKNISSQNQNKNHRDTNELGGFSHLRLIRKKNIKYDDNIKNEYNTYNNSISKNSNLNNNIFTNNNIGSILKGKIKKEENTNNKSNNNIIIPKNKNETKINLKEILKKELNDILFIEINEKFIRDKFEKEENEIMRSFYVRLLRQIKAANNPDLFNTNKYYANLKFNNIEKEALEDFNKGYFLITKFISELLDNLENNKNMPYSIKVICKFIFTLLTKKFKNISSIQCLILVNRFLFDKLLLPVLQNPDINDTGKNMIITLNTRKNLYDIYQVLKKLVRGELFNTEEYSYMTVFNTFLINNFERLNKIMENILRVNAPKKLMKLSEEFYKTEDFNLDQIIRDEESVNYDYFKENPHDFMHHKSICFSVKELQIFYDIVNNNKERFIQVGKPLEKIFENLSTFMNLVKYKPFEYNVIIRDNYNDDVNELLFIKEPKIILSKCKSKNDILANLKYCIINLISKLDIFPNWVSVTENFDTLKTFKYINSYLNSYYNNKNDFKTGTIPLNWYTLYIINNLEKLDEKYKINDFQLLYDSLESEILEKLSKFRNLNNFLTINMTTKNFLIDNKIKIYEKELENVQNTELNIKTVKFIESAKINVCLTNYMELNDLMKYFNSPLDSSFQYNPYLIVLSREENCIHQQKMEKKTYLRLKDSLHKNKNHCTNINEFTEHLSEYYNFICQDILDTYNSKNENINNNKNIEIDNKNNYKITKKPNKNDIYKISKKTMVKEVLDKYLEYVEQLMNNNKMFIPPKFINNNNENENLGIRTDSFEVQTKEEKENELIKKYEEQRQKSLNIITNYILKRLSIKIYETKLDNQDEQFKKICIKLKWIDHKRLLIPDEVFNKNFFEQVIEHVKKMDYLRTPKGMLYEFGIGVQLINSMFIFMLNQRQAEAGDLLPLIIYSIISAKPKKIIFNLKFIKFFMNQNQLLGNVGYNLIQCESSISYIKSIDEKQLKMDKQEFLDRCQLSMQEYIMNKENKKEIKSKDNKSNIKNIIKKYNMVN